MANIKQFVTPDNLGPDFEQDATAKEIKVNIDGVTLIRNAEGKLEAVGGGDPAVYNITELPEGATAPVATRVNALAAGAGAVASGLNSVAIGINAGASGIQSTALGINAVASGLQSTALGFNANTTKSRQVSIAPLSETTHLSATPRLLSGVKAPEVGQDAANKEYVDDLTAIDGTTIIRNAEGELEGTGASKEYVDDLTKVDGTTIIRNAEGELEGTGASKEYVDDLTAIDGVTVIRNAEGELVSVGEVSKEYVDDLTKVDGTTIIRNAEGELEAVGENIEPGLGVGQSWQNMIMSRAPDTLFTNTTGKTIAVSVESGTVLDEIDWDIELEVDGHTIMQFVSFGIQISGLGGTISLSGGGGVYSVFGLVPPGSTYKVKSSLGAFSNWMELR